MAKKPKIVDAEFTVVDEGRRRLPAPRPRFIDWRNVAIMAAISVLMAVWALLGPAP